MGNRIIEIVELGKPQSIIQREGDPITELIHTHILIEELNEQLLLYSVVRHSEQLKRNKTCFMCGKDKPNDGHTCCEDCGGVSF